MLRALPAVPLSALLASRPARGQGVQRPIPATAPAGILKIGVFPAAELNGKAITLGPGLRLYNLNNIIVTPASVQGVALKVAWLAGANGEIIQAWMLTDADYRARKN